MPLSIEQSVLEFHKKYGHYVADHPTTNVPTEVTVLRRKLIFEELDELMEGLALGNLREIADGAADLIYVVVGTCISYGIPIDRIFDEVHRSNMTKTPSKAENGEKYGTKTPKGPDYVAPDVEGILSNWSDPTFCTVLEGRFEIID